MQAQSVWLGDNWTLKASLLGQWARVWEGQEPCWRETRCSQSVQAGAEQAKRASPHEMSRRERLAGQRGTSAGGKEATTQGSPWKYVSEAKRQKRELSLSCEGACTCVCVFLGTLFKHRILKGNSQKIKCTKFNSLLQICLTPYKYFSEYLFPKHYMSLNNDCFQKCKT